MCILVTGAAGFIGYHTSRGLLDRGDEIIAFDNLNAYYEVRLKVRDEISDSIGPGDRARPLCLHNNATLQLTLKPQKAYALSPSECVASM